MATEVSAKKKRFCLWFDGFSKVFFTTVIIFAPILLVYALGIMTFSLFDFFLTLSLLFIVVSHCLNGLYLGEKFCFRNNVYFPILAFGGYVLLSLTFGFWKDLSSILRTFRYLYYLGVIAVVLKRHFLKNIGSKILIWLMLVSTAWLFLQFVAARFFGYYLTGFIPKFPLLDPNLYTIGDQVKSSGFRPRSFFQEPAHYATSALIVLYIVFFFRKTTWKEYVVAFLMIAGILVSSSTLGIAAAAVLFVMKLFLVFRHGSKRTKIITASVVVGGAAVLGVGLWVTGYLQSIINKVTSGNSFLARFDGFVRIWDFSGFFEGLQSLFGHGMIGVYDYISGLPRLVFYFGIPGYLLFLAALCPNRKSLPYALFFLFLNLGSEVGLGPYCILFYGFYIAYSKEPLVQPMQLRLKARI